MASEHLGLWGIPSFFPTPDRVANALIDRANIQPGDVILEPSAGKGNIARLIRERYPNNQLLVIERDPLLRLHLLVEGFDLVGTDFLTFREPVDVVIQNPPFSNNYQDIDHFCHAWRVARRCVVSLLHEYSVFKQFDRPTYKPMVFQRWLVRMGLSRTRVPNGFLDSECATPVRTAIVWGSK